MIEPIEDQVRPMNPISRFSAIPPGALPAAPDAECEDRAMYLPTRSGK